MNSEVRLPARKASMENEIISAVIVLYLLIAATMFAVHALQPDGQATQTSSTSPSHAEPAAREAQP